MLTLNDKASTGQDQRHFGDSSLVSSRVSYLLSVLSLTLLLSYVHAQMIVMIVRRMAIREHKTIRAFLSFYFVIKFHAFITIHVFTYIYYEF